VSFWTSFELLTCLDGISSRLWAARQFWALFESLTWWCFYEILSSLWVAGQLLGFIWINDMHSWNLVQNVSCWAPPKLYLNQWYAFMKSCPGCELLCTSQVLFESLTCLLWNPVQHVSSCAFPRLYLNHWHVFYEILSRLWVSVHFPGSIWITDMSSMKSCPACELLCFSQAPFESLTCLLWNPVQLVSFCAFPRLHLTCLLWNPVQGVSCCAPPRLYLNHWHAFYEILYRVWVAVHLPGSIWITDMPSMKSCPVCELLCTSQAPFESLTCLL